jgi:hypothetical protein
MEVSKKLHDKCVFSIQLNVLRARTDLHAVQIACAMAL